MCLRAWADFPSRGRCFTPASVIHRRTRQEMVDGVIPDWGRLYDRINGPALAGCSERYRSSATTVSADRGVWRDTSPCPPFPRIATVAAHGSTSPSSNLETTTASQAFLEHEQDDEPAACVGR